MNLNMHHNRPLMFVGGQLLANRHQCRPRFNGERGGDFVHVVQLFLHSRS